MKLKRLFQFLIISSLLLAVVGAPPQQAQAGNGNDEFKADPRLLQMAEENPDAVFMVIVQKDAKNKDLKDMEVEDEVLKGGGQVKKQLDLIVSFSAEMTGKEIVKLAKHPKVRWISVDAPMVSAGLSSLTVRDDFNIFAYGNNLGTAMWSTDWSEVGDDGSPNETLGLISIKTDAGCPIGGTCLEVKSENLHSISRGANLANVSSALLSFNFAKASGGQSVLEASKDNGGSWTILQTFSSSASTTATIDLLPYASANTLIRFRVTATGGGELWVDNLQIQYLSNDYTPTDAFADEFNSISYGGSNGSSAWTSNPWLELGETDGVNAGKVRVVSSAKCVAGNCLQIGGQNVVITNIGTSRTVNLSQAFNPVLTFQYRRDVAKTTTATVSAQVSADGVMWTTLATYSFASADTAMVSQSFDISAFKSANTRVRFIGSGTAGTTKGTAYLLVDNVKITYATLSAYIRATRVDQLRQAMPALKGQGVTVAVVDSGIANHIDLLGRTIASVNTTNETDTNDNYVHGTHVAGIIGGNGAESGGLRAGMAPQVNLVNVKVSDSNGMSYASDFVEGLQWIYNNKAAYNIKVVNISMNSSIAESYHTSPIDAAVEILWFNGIVVVVSAGNNGSTGNPSTLYPPANDPFVITVGATEDKITASLADDTMAVFSAYGITENGFAKPDLVAPGRNIISLLSGTTATGWVNHPLHRFTDNYYFRMSGTSMSAPMVSGAVALLLQDEPSLTPDQVKYRLMSTANKTWTNYDATKAGAGYLDVYAAVTGTTTQSANTGIYASQMLSSGSTPISWGSVGWNSVGWNSVGWNSVGWNSVGWNSVGWNSNSAVWDD